MAHETWDQALHRAATTSTTDSTAYFRCWSPPPACLRWRGKPVPLSYGDALRHPRSPETAGRFHRNLRRVVGLLVRLSGQTERWSIVAAGVERHFGCRLSIISRNRRPAAV